MPPAPSLFASLLATVGLLACDVEETGALGGRPDALLDCAAMQDAEGCDCAPGSTRDALHWSPSTFVARPDGRRCLEVVLHPDLAEVEPPVVAGLALWESLSCSGLCFAEPRLGTVDPRDSDTGLLYIFPVERQGVVTVSTLSFAQDSLRIGAAQVSIDVDGLEALDPAVRAAAIAGELGRSIGLMSPPSGTPSIVASRLDDLVFEPTPDDEAAFCAVYGAGGVCALSP